MRRFGITKTTIVGYLQILLGVVELLANDPIIQTNHPKFLGVLLIMFGVLTNVFRIMGLRDGKKSK